MSEAVKCPAAESAAGPVEDPRLRSELARLEATVHGLNAKFAQERLRVAGAHRDIEAFTFWLDDAERRIAHLQRFSLAARLQRLRDRLKGGRAAPRRGPEAPPPDGSVVPGMDFRYFIRNSPFRIYREPTFVLEGWAMPSDGAAVTGLRARVDSEVYFGTYGIEEPFEAAWHDVQPQNPRPGFKIIIDTPVGRRRLSLEAQVGGRPQWYSFLTLPIWCVGAGADAKA